MEKMQFDASVGKIFYASDHHFFHQKVFETCRLGKFESVEEMNSEIVARHNAKVGDNDIVYFLGDVIFCKHANMVENLAQTLGEMRGHKRLILGNHDYRHVNQVEFTRYFETIKEVEIVWDGDRTVHLMHYPMLAWWNKRRGSYHVHGHTHGDRGPDFEVLREQENALSSCLEVNNFEPCTLDELIENNRSYKLR